MFVFGQPHEGGPHQRPAHEVERLFAQTGRSLFDSLGRSNR